MIDGGANFGIYTTRLQNLVGPEGRVIAVEPLPFLLSYLSNKLASAPNITLINAALTNAFGPNISLHVPHIAPGLMEPALASLQFVKDPKSTFRVSATTLDTVARDLGSLSFIKLDLEGHELQALQGATRCLRVLRPIIQIEENDVKQNRRQWEEFCKDNSYFLCQLSGRGQIVKVGPAVPRGHNFYLVPSGHELVC